MDGIQWIIYIVAIIIAIVSSNQSKKRKAEEKARRLIEQQQNREKRELEELETEPAYESYEDGGSYEDDYLAEDYHFAMSDDYYEKLLKGEAMELIKVEKLGLMSRKGAPVKILGEEFDIERAIVYSEILKPKFKEL